MNIINLISEHAAQRCQQRGICAEALDAVLAFGSIVDHGGCKKYYMDRRARQRARNELGDGTYRQIADRLNVYAVVASDGTIVTVARLRKRVRVSKPHRPGKHPAKWRRRRF